MSRRIIGVVDDDLNMLSGIENMLDAHGFSAKIFDSAESFLAFLDAKTHFDCLVLDLHLGGMSGMELSRRLKIAGCTIPVIFMTAFDDQCLRAQALAEGCVAFLRKPFSSQSLIREIKKAVGRKQCRRQ